MPPGRVLGAPHRISSQEPGPMGVRRSATRAQGYAVPRPQVPVLAEGMPEARVPEAPDRLVPGRRQVVRAVCST